MQFFMHQLIVNNDFNFAKRLLQDLQVVKILAFYVAYLR
jgi:hypothetical protein